MCYGQLNGDAIQNLLSFLPFFFLTHFPFLGTTRLTCSVIWSLESYLFNWMTMIARSSLADRWCMCKLRALLDLSWFSSFQVSDTLFSQWSVTYQSKSPLESFRFTFTENGNVNLYHMTKFSLYLSFTVYNTKISSWFLPDSSIWSFSAHFQNMRNCHLEFAV